MPTEPLSDQIRSKKSRYTPSDPDWVQFVRDHRRQLMNRAVTVNINPDRAFRLRYRPAQLLRELDRSPELAWIILLINDISSVRQFEGIESLLLPDDEEAIDDLYESYITYIRNLENADKELSEAQA